MKIILIITTFVFTVASIIWLSKGNNNNVCKTFDDYYSDRDSNKNCYYHPDYELTVPEVVKRNGYPIETYEVTTIDGYILTLFRIPHGRVSSGGRVGRTLFLQHGAHSNSGCFVNIGNKSLAFILADAGYDVWLGNSRGSKYSLNHVHLNHSTDDEFWNFTLHEFGIYDLPAELGLVQTKTNEKIIYVGYSLGTTIMYIYATLFPEKARDQIKLFFNLAPAAFLGEEYFTLPKFASFFFEYVEPIFATFNGYHVASPYILSADVLGYICLPLPFQMKLCQMVHAFVLGSSYESSDPETLPAALVHNCDKTSLKVWSHMSQLWYRQTFGPYDYGEDLNLKHYGIRNPTDYNLSKVLVPTYFMHAQSDLLTTRKDVDKLYYALPEQIRPKEIYVVKEEGVGHLGYIVTKNVVSLFHNQIVKVNRRVTAAEGRTPENI